MAQAQPILHDLLECTPGSLRIQAVFDLNNKSAMPINHMYSCHCLVQGIIVNIVRKSDQISLVV